MSALVSSPTIDHHKVRLLNDRFRQSLDPRLGRLVLQPAVVNLPSNELDELLAQIREFDNFDEGNDPFGEHDFGALVFNRQRYFFKLDYYDRSLRYHSEQPDSPLLTIRVLTVMRADEW